MPATVAAAPQPQPQAPPPAPAQQATQLSHALMQGLAQLMQQHQQAPAQAYAAPAAAPAPAPARAAARVAPAQAAAPLPLPDWCKPALTGWWQTQAASGTPSSPQTASPGGAGTVTTTLSSAELGVMCSHLGQALRVGVVSEAAKITNETLYLKTSASGLASSQRRGRSHYSKQNQVCPSSQHCMMLLLCLLLVVVWWMVVVGSPAWLDPPPKHLQHSANGHWDGNARHTWIAAAFKCAAASMTPPCT